jgi:hypothetical protein
MFNCMGYLIDILSKENYLELAIISMDFTSLVLFLCNQSIWEDIVGIVGAKRIFFQV